MGRAGTGMLTIANGGAVSASAVTIGADSVGRGELTITGAASSLTNAAHTQVGFVGTQQHSVPAWWRAELPTILATELRGTLIAHPKANAGNVIGVSGEQQPRFL